MSKTPKPERRVRPEHEIDAAWGVVRAARAYLIERHRLPNFMLALRFSRAAEGQHVSLVRAIAHLDAVTAKRKHDEHIEEIARGVVKKSAATKRRERGGA